MRIFKMPPMITLGSMIVTAIQTSTSPTTHPCRQRGLCAVALALLHFLKSFQPAIQQFSYSHIGDLRRTRQLRNFVRQTSHRRSVTRNSDKPPVRDRARSPSLKSRPSPLPSAGISITPCCPLLGASYTNSGNPLTIFCSFLSSIIGYYYFDRFDRS